MAKVLNPTRAQGKCWMTCLSGFAAIAWASRSFADVHKASRQETGGSGLDEFRA